MTSGIYKRTNIQLKKMSEGQLKRKKRDGYINSPEARIKVSKALRKTHRKNGCRPGRIVSPNKTKAILGDKYRIGKNNPFYGKKHSAETKRKNRESSIAYIEKTCGRYSPRIGKNEKKILDNLEKTLNYKIDRSFRVEGYFPDGYIHKLNLIIEVDERPKNTEKDIEREQIIKNTLNCKFLRIKDYN